MNPDCPLCRQDGGRVLWRNGQLRIVLPEEPDHPALLRVIWNSHVREMTDLDAGERAACMQAVFDCELALRDVVRPDKVNVASLGNVVPHLHWHVVPRFQDDPQFPDAIWAARRRDTPRQAPADLFERLTEKLRLRV